MADYYPLLAKAVSGLKTSTPEARHAIYDRARKALLGQLRAMQPPAPDGAIEREAEALDEAIARLESEFLSRSPAESALAESAAPEPAPVASEQELSPLPPAPPPRAEPVEDEEAVVAAPRENARPAAPKPEVTGGGGWRRLAIVIGALALVVAMVGFAAWKLRDRPEDLARLAPTTETSDQKPGGKIGERIGADGQATRSPGGAGANLAVAYRAAVLVQAPDEPGGIKTYIGSVVWRRDSANRGPNQQLSPAIRAEVDVPEAKLNMSMVIEKNYETALSVSHTITIRFDPAADSPIGAVKAINMPEMRRDDAPKGSALFGLPVEIASNVFLVGLASASETQNLELLQGPNWFDIPMSLASGRIAKVTFEKGAGGEKLFADVLAEWKASTSQ
jgi:hypothetical protein